MDKPTRLWSMFDSLSAETEVLDFLHVLVRLVKPERILETGTWIGLSACAIGTAIAANGFGRLTTLEINGEAYECALRLKSGEYAGRQIKVATHASIASRTSAPPVSREQTLVAG